MTTDQLKVLHIYRRKLEGAAAGAFTRAEYDLLLVNIGHVRPTDAGEITSKALSNTGFERVMAFLEGWLEKFDPEIGRRWRSIDDKRRAGLISRRQEWEVGKLIDELGTAGGPRYSLDGLAHRQSNCRTTRLTELTNVEASNLVEMLKAALSRQFQRKEAQ